MILLSAKKRMIAKSYIICLLLLLPRPATSTDACAPPPAPIPGGSRHISIDELGKAYGMSPDDGQYPKLMLLGQRRKLQFLADDRKMVVDGVTLWLNGNVSRRQGSWVIEEEDRRLVLDPLLHPFRHISALDHRVVVLDPGHGGHDPGAVGINGLMEKDVVLDIAHRVKRRLTSEGLTVVMTRRDDRFLDLSERTLTAKAHDADIFVSLHANSAGSSTARGIETFRLSAPGYPAHDAKALATGHDGSFPGNRFDAANTILGYAVQRRLVQETSGLDRGLKHARFQVLREAPCPAILVECGFLCNPDEASALSRNDYRNQIADGIADGILDYVSILRRAKLIQRIKQHNGEYISVDHKEQQTLPCVEQDDDITLTAATKRTERMSGYETAIDRGFGYPPPHRRYPLGGPAGR